MAIYPVLVMNFKTQCSLFPLADKPVLLVVFHHTFDDSYIAPDSRWIVKREGVAAVDVLFHEDMGLLRGLANDTALKSSTDYLISLGASQVGFEQLTNKKVISNII